MIVSDFRTSDSQVIADRVVWELAIAIPVGVTEGLQLVLNAYLHVVGGREIGSVVVCKTILPKRTLIASVRFLSKLIDGAQNIVLHAEVVVELVNIRLDR